VGVAYWHPVDAADRVVDLTMIAVDPMCQGRGVGRALMRHAEDRARSAGQRLMVVLTSATDQYAGTRRFYAALGYEEEARVRDYWADGDDMVLFRLVL
jgi:ribosomal protein S18 acetylase RimI-like enzyme